MNKSTLRVLPKLALCGMVFCAFTVTANPLPIPSKSDRLIEIAQKKTKKSKTQIQWHVKPDNVEIHLDGKLLGKASTLKLTPTKAGMHTVRLVNGLDETEFDLQLRKNQTLRFEFTFEP